MLLSGRGMLSIGVDVTMWAVTLSSEVDVIMWDGHVIIWG